MPIKHIVHLWMNSEKKTFTCITRAFDAGTVIERESILYVNILLQGLYSTDGSGRQIDHLSS